MNARIFGCEKFKRLSFEAGDRALTEREQVFLRKHRAVCPECVLMEDQSVSALDVLRSVALDAQVSPLFEERVLRRLKVSKTRDSLRYWSPALVGAGIAGIVIFTALQMVATTVSQPGFKSNTAEGSLIRKRSELPLILLDDRPSATQIDSVKRVTSVSR